MKKKIECNYNRRNNLATVTIMALKSFNDECLDKIKQIAELFALKTLYFDFEVYEQDKEAIFSELRTLDEKAPCIVAKRKNKRRLSYQGTIDNLLEILMIAVKYNLEDSTFFEPKNFSWEQFLIDGAFEDDFYQYDTADAVFTVCSHNGFHFIVFRTDKFDYNDTISKIEKILN